ncbi:MAG TPA: hypothetical protein VJO35_05550 [Terriglobales bacterium]|nr:hypothetical protein [Terriglobales bacterium]
MKSSVRRFWPAVLMFVSCFAPSTFAQVNADVTSAGGFGYDGVYISPYYASIGKATNQTIICDDFADETYLNTPWQGTITQFSNLSSSLGSTVWGSWELSQGTLASSIVQLYDEAAWLTLGLLSQPKNSINEAYYSYAEWAVFDPNGVFSWLGSHNDVSACTAIFGYACTGTYNNVPANGSLLYSAQHNYWNGNYSNLALLSPVVGNVVCVPGLSGQGNCPAQEFFVTVPEGGTTAMYLVFAFAVCLGAIYFRSRRPNAATRMA